MASPSSARHSAADFQPAPVFSATSPATATGAPRETAAVTTTHFPATASNVREALDAVIKIADAQASRTEAGASTVSVGFKFGEERLDIRVEMRDGEVHTRFSTDSTDLRSAISGEWQALSSSTASRGYHFADPVFTSSGGQAGGTASDAGGGASRGQPDAEAPAPADGFFSGSEDPAESPAFGASLPPREADPTVRHLNAFA